MGASTRSVNGSKSEPIELELGNEFKNRRLPIGRKGYGEEEYKLMVRQRYLRLNRTHKNLSTVGGQVKSQPVLPE